MTDILRPLSSVELPFTRYMHFGSMVNFSNPEALIFDY